MAIKILIGGSPCTHWSIAQKNNRETEAEGIGWELFKNYLIAKEKFNPDFFLYENNKSAAQAIKDQIAYELSVGTDPMARFTYINSALVSAQNRQRFYVTNFGDIEQPTDREILLRDILETGKNLTNGDKSFCLTASYDGACAWNTIERSQRTMVAEPVAVDLQVKGRKANPDGEYEREWEARTDGKSSCLTTVESRRMVAEPIRIGDLPNQKGEISGSQATRIYDVNGKSVNLVANGGGQGAKTGLYAVPIYSVPHGFNQGGVKYRDKASTLTANGDYPSNHMVVDETPVNRKLDRLGGLYEQDTRWGIWNTDGISPTLTAAMGMGGGHVPMVSEETSEIGNCDKNPTDGKQVYEVKNGLITIKDKHYPIKLADGYYIIRKLTVKECCRLQTMPDDYCKAVSNSQAYKGLGNGWTAEVIIHLLHHALKDVPRDEEIVVLSLYDGIGTGRYCLEKMGFTNVTYHAYEIDKFPMQIAMDNYPDIIQHGDAFAVREDDWKPPQSRSTWLDALLEVM